MKKVILSAACAAMVVFSACDNMSNKTEEANDEATEATADTAVAFENENNQRMAADGAPIDVDDTDSSDWNDIDVDMPTVDWPEVRGTGVEVRENKEYSVYSLGEDILFDTDKAEIRQGAEQNLKMISESIAQRSKNGQVRIYGYTDARASASYNKELAEQRAEAVKNWLQKNGNINASRLSVHPVGEAKPTATNETAKGRQQNRRVEIAVRRTGS